MYEKIRNYIIMGVRKSESRFFSPACGHCLRIKMAARHLARIHGTEEDKINCPFYFKIGACRHSDRCSRIHHRPAFSPTILIKHVYRHPIREAELRAAREGRSVDDVGSIDEDKARDDFLIFFE